MSTNHDNERDALILYELHPLHPVYRALLLAYGGGALFVFTSYVVTGDNALEH